jgi:hypothetical protein
MKRSLPDACLRGRVYNPRVIDLFLEQSLACGLLLSVMVIGCAGSLDPGVGGNSGMGGSSGADCQTMIFNANCVGCHGSASPAVGLDLQSPNVETRLVGIATGSGSSCPGANLLDKPSNPATGVFIQKVTMMTPTCGGLSMPYGLALLSQTDQQCLTSWATSLTMNAAFTGQETP